MEYKDFEVQIGPHSSQGLHIRVLQSPAGEGEALVRLSGTSGDPELLSGMARNLGDESLGLSLSPTEIGDYLFRSVFTGQVSQLFHQSLGVSSLGLRICLRISPRDPTLASLWAMPWELLYRKDTEEFLALSHHTPIVRSFTLPQLVAPRSYKLPLRILAVLARDSEGLPLSLEEELRQLQEELEKESAVRIEVLKDPDTNKLRRALDLGAFHILHYMGDGGFDPDNGGFLLFGGPQGRLPVTGRHLAIKIKDLYALRLVVLSASETAVATGEAARKSFAGVAASLILGGTPAVLAMQFAVPYDTGPIFSRIFYNQLARGASLEEALTEGRQAICSTFPNTADWAAPVLFTRSPYGQLFKQPVPSKKPPRKAEGSRLGKALGFLFPGKGGIEGIPPIESPRSLRHFEALSVHDIFISYSHDSPEHMKQVLALCDRLRVDGVDAWIDQYEISPSEGWPRWSDRQVREADFVLVVCTATYARRFSGTEEENRGLGVCWEGYVIAQELYDAGSRNVKYVPVLLPPTETQVIPPPLRGATRYDLSSEVGYWRLYRHLTGQPETDVPPLGKRVPLPTRERRADFARPALRYQDERTRVLAESLTEARQRFKNLTIAGRDTTDIRSEVLRLRREMRDGIRLQVGDFLAEGRFQLLAVLGRGGFATVWKAWDDEREKIVALKMLHGPHAEDRSRLERFFRGARRMSALRHPGIVRVLDDRLEDDDHHGFVMEFIAGEDLHKAVLAGKLPSGRVLQVILSVGEALDFAHHEGVIHRDVKPANILLASEGAKLTDFDLVHAMDTTGGTRTQGMGTFLYTAPEILNDARKVTITADVYSLAMTAIFAFLCRDLPFDVLRRPEFVIGALPCAPEIRTILLRATSWDPADRPESVAALCQALRNSEELPAPGHPAGSDY